MNVSITRAKKMMFLVGNKATLSDDTLWNQYLHEMLEKSSLYTPKTVMPKFNIKEDNNLQVSCTLDKESFSEKRVGVLLDKDNNLTKKIEEMCQVIIKYGTRYKDGSRIIQVRSQLLYGNRAAQIGNARCVLKLIIYLLNL